MNRASLSIGYHLLSRTYSGMTRTLAGISPELEPPGSMNDLCVPGRKELTAGTISVHGARLCCPADPDSTHHYRDVRFPATQQLATPVGHGQTPRTGASRLSVPMTSGRPPAPATRVHRAMTSVTVAPRDRRGLNGARPGPSSGRIPARRHRDLGPARPPRRRGRGQVGAPGRARGVLCVRDAERRHRAVPASSTRPVGRTGPEPGR